MIAVISLQRADNSPVLTYGHLGLVEVNGEHRLLHVSAVAQPISVNVLFVFCGMRINPEFQGHK